MGLMTNLINRLRVIFLEDVGAGAPLDAWNKVDDQLNAMMDLRMLMGEFGEVRFPPWFGSSRENTGGCEKLDEIRSCWRGDRWMAVYDGTQQELLSLQRRLP